MSAADSALDNTPWCVCPVLISSLSVLLEEYGPISRGAGSPDASPVSSSLSMGTIPKDDQNNKGRGYMVKLIFAVCLTYAGRFPGCQLSNPGTHIIEIQH